MTIHELNQLIREKKKVSGVLWNPPLYPRMEVELEGIPHYAQVFLMPSTLAVASFKAQMPESGCNEQFSLDGASRSLLVQGTVEADNLFSKDPSSYLSNLHC